MSSTIWKRWTTTIKLIDRLASYKINGIIVELEDKLKYESQPLIGSADALSKEEWLKLSTYALTKNIKMSPLVQGLGHASLYLNIQNISIYAMT